jgi:photosystem II stability/assembly factor-like uncharacterized protein
MTQAGSGWERLAAFEGGTVTSLATATAADGTRHVFAATIVGVFFSTDRGLSWSPLGGASRVAGVEVVATSPYYPDDGVVFAGAYDGLFRWREGGTAWEHLLSGSRVLSVAVAPGDPSALADGSGLTVLAGTESDGILISRDGGRTWDGANAGLLDLEILALAASQDFERDGLAYAATPTTVYRTRNGAESWRDVELPSSVPVDVGAQCLALSAEFAEDRVILAGGVDLRLLRSDDRGRSWEEIPDLSRCDVFSITSLSGRRAVAATDQGVALSDDGGVSWRLVGTDLDGVLSAAAIKDGPQTLLIAGVADRGVVRSEDGGENWTAVNRGLTANPFVGLLFSQDFERDQTVYAYGLQTYFGISNDGGRTWTTRNDDLEEVTAVAALPDGKLVLATEPEAAWRKLPKPFDQAEIVAVAVAPGSGDQQDGGIYVATAGATGAGEPPAIVLWRTTDRGRRWDRWLEDLEIPGGGAVQAVALPPNRWGDTVALGFGGRVLRPRQNAWEVKGGARRPVWDAVDLPAQDGAVRLPVVTSLAASPAYLHDRTVFAATSAGVFVSRDGGASFSAWNDGLEPTATVAVTPSPAYAHDRLVYALGLGGAIWRRRDRL